MKKHFLITTSIVCCVSFANAQQKPVVPVPVKADSTGSAAMRGMPPGMAKPGPRPFKEVITDKAVTTRGLFTVHKVEDKYYFEIPDSLFSRDILIVSRISRSAADVRPGMMGFAGDQINESVVRFEKGPNNKVFLKNISFQEFSKDSTADGMYRNVKNSNLQPIVAAFDIKAFNKAGAKDSSDTKSNRNESSVVLDFTDYCAGDNDVFFFDSRIKSAYKLGGLQPDKSYIDAINAYPLNVEIKTVKTYMVSSGPAIGPGGPGGGGSAPATYELNTSVVLLPKVPMKARYFDKRVGYFATGYVDFDKNPQGIEKVSMITRFRLEPKDEDIEKYKRGELVEPKTPIVYYIDPTTPKKWVPYLMQGVNDWQVAFEKAGFKNAIIAKEAPTNDPTFSIEDARHNALIYKPSAVANASGPHVHDPRSGEIIETHINWYHSVMTLVHHWYMIQTAAVDPRARKMVFDDELMGQLIRFVSSHEVGHTLGLRHNFGSSSTVPVEKLRDKQWLAEHGHTPSIMDYARFNYVAQPEDNIPESGLFPRIGEYDKWAIQWGYKWMPEYKNAEAEEAYLNKWIVDSLKANPRLWFGTEGDILDARNQSEDLGDNAMKAGAYGIKNLKRILPQLEEWTKKENNGYDDLDIMYKELLNQFGRYMGHVTKNVGGRMETPKSREQSGDVFTFMPKAKQKEAIAFLQDNLFSTPTWLINNRYSKLTGLDPLSVISRLQDASLDRIFNSAAAYGFLKTEAWQGGDDVYTLPEMWNDLKKGIWSELRTHKPIDIYRKSLQKDYVDKLSFMITGPSTKSEFTPQLASVLPMSGRFNEVAGLAKVHGKELAAEIKAAIPSFPDARTKAHLQDMADLINAAIKNATKAE
ncbi:MAG: zinc-dependent metalloprotease [Filimonas sp.]|nr:zinc-dependent metalloprotease [Filimonas sp.]